MYASDGSEWQLDTMQVILFELQDKSLSKDLTSAYRVGVYWAPQV